jgi:hypothetical protein
VAATSSTSIPRSGTCSRAISAPPGPSVHPARGPRGRALLEGEILEGLWFDRTQEYLARRRGETFDRLQYATREILELDPLPCWKHLPEAERHRRIAAFVEDIEAETAARRRGREPSLWAQPPSWPKTPSGSRRRPRSLPRRLSTQRARRSVASSGTPTLSFVAAYRDAAEKLRAGVRNVVFPTGSFPPALPFVGG